MKIQEVIKALRTNSAKVVGKGVGISDKTLSKALKNAGYAYESKGGKGWYYTGRGEAEAPLHQNIKDFIEIANNAPEKVSNADTSSSYTKSDMKVLHEIIGELGSIKELVNALSKRRDGALQSDDSSENVEPLYSLYIRTKELASKEKVRRTMNLDKKLCVMLDNVENQSSLNRDDIVEVALRTFFEKYSHEYRA
ncbi:CopG family transcriptional regulator [Bacillus sp. SIMBA_074]|uniref:CopG family transcriptional regulator n=1 Tax=Bacillus sp. SIMBA_074 TaxID=3085812 RepID=UPI00397E6D19